MAVGRSQKIPTALINYPVLGFDNFPWRMRWPSFRRGFAGSEG